MGKFSSRFATTEAIEKIKAWNLDADKMEVLTTLIPELTASEDEEIRKSLINYVYCHGDAGDFTKKEFIAWIEKQKNLVDEYEEKLDKCACDNFNKGYKAALEKQDEKNTTEDYSTLEITDVVRQALQECESFSNIRADVYAARVGATVEKLIKKQGEQNLADKIEPKFKIGDWVMLDRPVLITKVEDMAFGTHQYWTSYGTWFGDATKAKLWTIQDAKDGDVLIVDNITFIYKRTLANHIVSCCKLVNNIFEPFDDARTCCEGNKYVHPATKEQRNALFAKMKEARYEWDAEKKELNKIEPKFKVGDWVVSPNGVYWHINKISNNRYEVTSNTGESSNWNLDTNIYHKFTIQDAKDGDVLAVEPIDRYKFPFIAICKNYGLNFFNSYCSIGFDGKFYEADTEHVLDGIHPATKEQRDLLFQKMKEVGYEWHAEHKQLKKIKQKPAWSEEDEKMLNFIINIFKDSQRHGVSEPIMPEQFNRIFDWLKPLKERISNFDDGYKVGFSAAKHNQWKPSREQMATFWDAICNLSQDGYKWINDMNSLYQDLKKLTE